MHYLDRNCAPGGQYRHLKVINVRVRAVWLGHGSYAAIGSFFTGSLTANPITHWWVEIQTERSNVWFCAQFEVRGGSKSALALTQHDSASSVTRHGESTANRWGDNPSITDKQDCPPYSGTIMGDIYDWMENYSSEYGVVMNNCQDFGN